MINFLRISWFISMLSTCIYNIEAGNTKKSIIFFLASFLPFIGNVINELRRGNKYES